MLSCLLVFLSTSRSLVKFLLFACATHFRIYIKILQRLNESSSGYLNANPVDKHFAKIGEQLLDKVNTFVSELSRELATTLHKHYPSYADAPTPTSSTLASSSADLTKLKSNINEHMASMLNQMHNDIW